MGFCAFTRPYCSASPHSLKFHERISQDLSVFQLEKLSLDSRLIDFYRAISPVAKFPDEEIADPIYR